jgi:hypothetical protein
MKISRQRISQASLFFLATVVLSSCNRGYGCPSNFDLGETVLEVTKTALSFLF